MVNLYNRGSYLGFECNFRFLKLPYFGCQVTIWAWNANCSHNCGTILFSRSTLRRIYFHNFFLSVASSEVLIQRCLLMKYGTSIGGFSFKITVLNIFGKIFRKTAVSWYAAWLCAFNMHSVVNDFSPFSENFLGDAPYMVWLFLKPLTGNYEESWV